MRVPVSIGSGEQSPNGACNSKFRVVRTVAESLYKESVRGLDIDSLYWITVIITIILDREGNWTRGGEWAEGRNT